MAAVQVNGSSAFDGGYTDNAPIPEQEPAQRQRTLVLLTRRYPTLPAFFQLHGRTYWQPSQPVPVSTWDCTARCTVDAAYELGRRDGADALRAGRIRAAGSASRDGVAIDAKFADRTGTFVAAPLNLSGR